MNRVVILVVAEGIQIWVMNSAIQIIPVNYHALHHSSLYDCFVTDSIIEIPSFSTCRSSCFVIQHRSE